MLKTHRTLGIIHNVAHVVGLSLLDKFELQRAPSPDTTGFQQGRSEIDPASVFPLTSALVNNVDGQFVAGNVSNWFEYWWQLTSLSEMLSSVQGIEIPFDQLPIQTQLPNPYKSSKAEKQSANPAINKLLEGVIAKTAYSEGHFVSNIFLRPKPKELIWSNSGSYYSK